MPVLSYDTWVMRLGLVLKVGMVGPQRGMCLDDGILYNDLMNSEALLEMGSLGSPLAMIPYVLR